MTGHFEDSGFVPLNIAILTVSDSRTEADDKSGRTLRDRAAEAGLYRGPGMWIVTVNTQCVGAHIDRAAVRAGYLLRC